MRSEVASDVLPLRLDLSAKSLSADQVHALQAIEIEAARVAIQAVAELGKLNEVDHLGGGLGIISPLALTLALTDFEKVEYTIENAHCSVGYYGVLAAYGFLDPEIVVSRFRRSLDIPGHVSWVPGGTQLNGGRLGVMVPTAVGQALGKKARHGAAAWIVCHCGDAGWISGQALNGFNGADLHGAPITFVMDRNGIQLSGSNRQIMDKDPRPIIKSLGIEILETSSLHDHAALFAVYKEAFHLAGKGRPSLIYPTGYKTTLGEFARKLHISEELNHLAAKNKVDVGAEAWIPGSLMSYREPEAMLECVFLVNNLPGGKGHHDGHLKGKDAAPILANPMLQLSADQRKALDGLKAGKKRRIVTRARPAPGSANLKLAPAALSEIKLPEAGKSTSARAGVEAAYAAIAKACSDRMFVVSCDLDPSTKLEKARTFLKREHQFEMSIEEQASSLIADGLAMASHDPQLVVFSTFAAFFDGIAREGLDMWRYQRNLNGINEGLNVVFHMSHVGACTGRDHFSGWSLDWINLAISYLPYLHRFYAPCDAGSAFVAIRDMAEHYGGHLVGIPRDNLPVLAKQDGAGRLWDAATPWTPVTPYRKHAGAQKAILAFGAPAYLAGEASDTLLSDGTKVDVLIVNGLPLPDNTLADIVKAYPDGIVTVEDGLIGDGQSGWRGFAGIVHSAAAGRVPTRHAGITDPRIAPSDGHLEVWHHFGITAEAIASLC